MRQVDEPKVHVFVCNVSAGLPAISATTSLIKGRTLLEMSSAWL
jgi:hypothetical protein